MFARVEGRMIQRATNKTTRHERNSVVLDNLHAWGYCAHSMKAPMPPAAAPMPAPMPMKAVRSSQMWARITWSEHFVGETCFWTKGSITLSILNCHNTIQLHYNAVIVKKYILWPYQNKEASKEFRKSTMQYFNRTLCQTIVKYCFCWCCYGFVVMYVVDGWCLWK